MKKKLKLITLLLLTIFVWQCSEQRKIHIYMIGDSTMSQYDSTKYPLTGWGMKFPLFFNENVTIHNFGKSGKSTKSFRDLGYWEVVKNSLKEGDYLIIQFGHNDEKAYDSTRYTTPYGTYKQNLMDFVYTARKKKAIPILVTPIRRRKFDENGKLLDTHGEYPNAMREVAKELNVPLIDLTKLSKPLIESYGVEGSKKLFLWVKAGEYSGYPDGKEDNTHFTSFGATEICKLVVNEIKKSDLGLKNYLINPDKVKEHNN